MHGHHNITQLLNAKWKLYCKEFICQYTPVYNGLLYPYSIDEVDDATQLRVCDHCQGAF